jgi:hypothetical protein
MSEELSRGGPVSWPSCKPVQWQIVGHAIVGCTRNMQTGVLQSNSVCACATTYMPKGQKKMEEMRYISQHVHAPLISAHW